MPTPEDPRGFRPTWNPALSGALLVAIGALAASVALTPQNLVDSDVAYYRAWGVWATANGGLSEALREYPTPAALLVWLPTFFTSSDASYRVVFVLGMAVVALLGLLALLTLPASRATRAGVTYLVSLGALGPIGFYRFDLVPGVLVLLACVALLLGLRGRWSLFLAAATAVKLWPVLLWPLGLVRRATRRRELVVAGLSSVVIIGVSVAVAGWARLVSPLTWQSGRGLQVESVAATWIYLARLVRPSAWTAALSQANSWDFSGPGVAFTLTMASLMQLGRLVWVVLLTRRVWLGGRGDADTITLVATSVVAGLMVTNKVFSPQYMICLLPVASLAVGVGRGRAPRWWAPGLVGLALLTQLSYPTTYGWLYPGTADWHFLLGTVLMTGRNLGLVAFAVSVSRAAWRASAPTTPPADEGGAALVVGGETPAGADRTGAPDPQRCAHRSRRTHVR